MFFPRGPLFASNPWDCINQLPEMYFYKYTIADVYFSHFLYQVLTLYNFHTLFETICYSVILLLLFIYFS